MPDRGQHQGTHRKMLSTRQESLTPQKDDPQGSQSTDQKAQRQGAIEELKQILLMLCERYPQAFSLKDPKPLKVGIFKDLQEALKDKYSKAQLNKELEIERAS